MNALLPCPFCGGAARLDRAGTRRQSCQVSCTQCGAHHESPDEDERSGESWNRREAQVTKTIEQMQRSAMGDNNEAAGMTKRMQVIERLKESQKRIASMRREERVPTQADDIYICEAIGDAVVALQLYERFDVNAMRLHYAGAIGLLAELSLHLRNDGEQEDLRDSIERACLDWAAQTKWGVKRVLSRFELVPPNPD